MTTHAGPAGRAGNTPCRHRHRTDLLELTVTSNPTPDPDSTPETARRDRYANALARITVGHSAFIKVDVQAEYKRAEAVMAVADTELAVLGEQLDEAGETIAQQTAALAQADERVEFYEAAHARMRDRLEVTRVRVRRAVAGSELESAVEAALAAAAPSVSAVDQTTRDRIAEALYAHDHPGHVVPLNETGMGPAYRESAAAIMPVLPPTADRAAVLREAADSFDRHAEQLLNGVGEKAVFVAKALRDQAAVWSEAAETLRRLAAEAQPEPACTDPIECSHEAALGQAEETLEVLHALGTAWSRPTMSAPTRVAGEHLLRVLGAAPDGVPAAGVRQPDTETPVPCSWVAVRSSHSPHDWQPQPGMDPVHCPGYRRPPMDPVHILGIEADQPAVPQRPYPDCERCGDSGTDPEQPGQPCPECQRPAADDSGEEA